MFDRFLEEARAAMKHARVLAATAGDGAIDVVHLLHGTLVASDSLAARALVRCEADAESLARWALLEAELAGAGAGRAGIAPFTAAAKRGLENALEEATQAGHDWIGTHHLLLGVLRACPGAERELLGRGISVVALRDATRRVHEDAARDRRDDTELSQ